MKYSLGTISAVDSSIFWGYLLTQVPGGFLAAKYPANRLFGAAIGFSSFLNLLVPGAYEVNSTVLIIVRVMQGLVEVSIRQRYRPSLLQQILWKLCSVKFDLIWNSRV